MTLTQILKWDWLAMFCLKLSHDIKSAKLEAHHTRQALTVNDRVHSAHSECVDYTVQTGASKLLSFLHYQVALRGTAIALLKDRAT